jgi:hypothetical protein
MNRHILFITLTAGIFSVMFPQSAFGQVGEDVADQNDVNSVTIALTRLDVNDTRLELSYKIKNKTDHDVWVCDSINTESTFNFEVYLDKDAKTLVLMKRLDIVPELEHPAALKGGRYVRMRPAQEYFENLLLDVPVGSSLLYIAKRANAEFATRLVIEIGFYNADVFRRIQSMIEVRERFNYTSVGIMDFQSDIMRRYFKGLLVTRLFGGLSHFDEVYINTDANALLSRYKLNNNSWL